MQRNTPWTKKGSALPSDRIRPANTQPKNQPGNAKGKGKQKQAVADPPKSKEVRMLESLLNGLRNFNGTERDPNGGCFCLAREHSLSAYTPICETCGLILCSLNLPQYCCPSCSKPLLMGGNRETIASVVDAELQATLEKERRDVERALEEARQAAGAFPTLSGPTPNPSTVSRSQNDAKQSHTVLSLNSGKVKVSSYKTTQQQSVSDIELGEETIKRVPRDSQRNISYLRCDPSRPWQNLSNSADYIPS